MPRRRRSSSLGFEHYDAHLRRLRLSLDVALAWADGRRQSHQARGVSALSRVVSFTDPFTKAARRLDRWFYRPPPLGSAHHA